MASFPGTQKNWKECLVSTVHACTRNYCQVSVNELVNYSSHKKYGATGEKRDVEFCKGRGWGRDHTETETEV